MTTTVLSRDAQIAEIIRLRRPLVERIVQIQKHLDKRSDILSRIEEHRKRLANSTGPDAAALVQPFHQLNFAAFQLRIASIQKELDRLKARFARPTLNIGVIGRARQGKSRMLQSMSG